MTPPSAALSDLLPAIHSLSRVDKVRVIELLVDDLARVAGLIRMGLSFVPQLAWIGAVGVIPAFLLAFIGWCLFMAFLRRLSAYVGDETLAEEAHAVMMRSIATLVFAPILVASAPLVLLGPFLICLAVIAVVGGSVSGLTAVIMFFPRLFNLISSIRQVILSRYYRRRPLLNGGERHPLARQPPPHIAAQLPRRGVAVLLLMGHGAGARRASAAAGTDGSTDRGRRRRARQDGVKGLDYGGASLVRQPDPSAIRTAPAPSIVNDPCGRPCRVVTPRHHFRGHVDRRADDGALVRDLRLRPLGQRDAPCGAGLADHLGQSPVHDHAAHRVAHDDVGRLRVPVQHAPRMGERQPAAGAVKHPQQPVQFRPDRAGRPRPREQAAEQSAR